MNKWSGVTCGGLTGWCREVLPLLLMLVLSSGNVLAKVDENPVHQQLDLSRQQQQVEQQISGLQHQYEQGKREAAAAAFALGKVALKVGEQERADQLFGEAVALNPTRMEYLGFAAEHAFALKRYVKAEQLVVRMITLQQQQRHPDWSSIVKMMDSLATLQHAQQHTIAARNTLLLARQLVQQRALKEGANVRVERLYKLLELDVALKQDDHLIHYVQEVIALLEQQEGAEYRHKLAESYHNMGEIYRMQQQFSEAEEAYRKALALWDQESDQGQRQAALTREGLSRLRNPATVGSGVSRVDSLNAL